jgi:putative peptidoglycan lipid II flippase
MAAAALLLAASVLLSRLTGFVREAVLAHQVGAGAAMDAYRAAFQLPDLLNYLLAGSALSIAFIPLYARAREVRGEAEAERLFATVLGTTGLLAALATAALWWWAEPLTAFQFRGFDEETQALTVRLTRIVLPAQVFFVVGGVLKAVLMARGRFGAQAAAPVVYNLAIIGFGLALGGTRGVEGFAWGALVGAAVGAFGIALFDARRIVRVRVRIAPTDRELLRYLVVAAPLMLGLSLLTVDEWYDRWFGAVLGEGAVARLGYARQLMLVPVAVVGQATAAAALPTLARLFSEGSREALDRTLLRTLQVALAVALLAGAGIFATAGPLVELVYRRGAFTPADAGAVALLLRIMCLAVPAWVLQQIAARAFYARGDTWRPMGLGTLVALAAVPLYLALGRSAGPPGLAAAGALGMSANALLTLLWARRRHGAPPLGPLAATGARALLVAAAAGAVAAIVQPGQPGHLGAFLDLALAGVAFAAVAAAGTLAIGDEALRAALGRLLRRRPRS